MHIYRYVGPQDIADRSRSARPGTSIRCPDDVRTWFVATGQHPARDGSITATFVVAVDGILLVADRHSEHVACAGGEPVRSAGEMTFAITRNAVQVAAVSNQSTGYRPAPESFEAVASALRAAGLPPPAEFTPRCVFRLCAACHATNIVKDGGFECGVCGAALPIDDK